MLDIVSYISIDYKNKENAEKEMYGVVMGITKSAKDIIGPEHFYIAISKEGENIYADSLELEQITLVENSKFIENRPLEYMSYWPKKNAVFRFDDDYAILIGARLSADIKKMTLQLYSMENCSSISETIYKMLDEVFLGRFKGFDDQILRDEIKMHFRRKNLGRVLDEVSNTKSLPSSYSELEKVKIYTLENEVQQDSAIL